MQTVPLCDPKEIAEYLKRKRVEAEKTAKAKTKTKPSGALPENTEWL